MTVGTGIPRKTLRISKVLGVFVHLFECDWQSEPAMGEWEKMLQILKEE